MSEPIGETKKAGKRKIQRLAVEPPFRTEAIEPA
ncbi:Unannotated [Lentimonas sp. CC19]|nr:Unannotated [Lentimonas sp. CC10]CAA6694042.1 Unannotated [Lentimonas sp. CC19]CAA7070286.1 Unannotated [Lentimonas sp. CC11]